MNLIEQAGPNLRRHARLQPDIGWIDIEGVRYRVEDVSISGVRVRPYDGRYRVGDPFSFRLHIFSDPDDAVIVDGGSVVVRSSPDEMAAQFFFLDPEQFPRFENYLDRQVRLRWVRILNSAHLRGAEK